MLQHQKGVKCHTGQKWRFKEHVLSTQGKKTDGHTNVNIISRIVKRYLLTKKANAY